MKARRITMAATAALLLSLRAGPVTAQQAGGGGFTPQQRQEIIGILRDALRQDPSILRDALVALQEAEEQERAGAQGAAIAANADALFRDPADPVIGNPRGDVTIVEFFDVRCGYCKQLHPTMADLLRRDRNLRVVLKDLPILGPNSVLSARALLAAQAQGKYAALYDALMALRTEPTEAVIRQQAERVGLDWARLRRDMDSSAIQQRIEANLRLARGLGVEGTPALVIGGALVPGAVPLAMLERMVAEARQAAAAPAAR